MNRFVSGTLTAIRFARYLFSLPVPLNRFVMPARLEGVYVLLVPDPTWGPWHLQPVFFGEIRADGTSQITAAEFTECVRIAAGKTLYIAVCPLLPHQMWESLRMLQELIDHYRPLVNRQLQRANVAELARRLEAIESKYHEHEALLKLALATLGQMVQTPAPSRKRAVGFHPHSARPVRVPPEDSNTH